MSNSVTRAASIAAKISNIEDCRAKVVVDSDGNVGVLCERNSGGKKGWLHAGVIAVAEKVTVSKETAYCFRYVADEFAAAIA